MNRALLKMDAKAAMQAANPHPALTTLVMAVVILAVTMVSQLINSIFAVIAEVSGEISLAVLIIVLSLILYLVVTFVTSALTLGWNSYALKVFSHRDTGISELFAFFRFGLKALGLTIAIAFFTTLWTFLCIIPGIIAGLRYSQAFFILAENPEKGVMQCIRESKIMMSGHLGEYFVLELSFILWLLLVTVTCGIAALYVSPYMQITMAGYYYSLKLPDDVSFTKDTI